MNLILINAIFSTLVNYLTLDYLNQFGKMQCKCSSDYKLHLLKNMIHVFYLLTFLKLAYNQSIPSSVQYFVIIFILAFDIIFFLYLRKLMTNKCLCQKEFTKLLYTYYLLVFLIILLSISFVTLYYTSSIFIMNF